ncbi:Small-conductance mechanosensitive channel [Pseudorhodobacter antarcticus]|uniref:Small-conductance mechanosensitive channel n=1 Tax=Pseudorhodobacter antarcticus TaxID=1077947 RepID=A0A1H8L340_9RHOB|nr:mechanosensitive ion channel domain-containing protein [Pseudorhodobacter antarcticus]SEN99610.1 Small-conductance mechanosensitive channel [Pseudorhodobacter antarcticus]
MTTRQHARRLVWPTALFTLTLGLVLFLFYTDISSFVEDSETLLMGLTSLTYFALAWLASRLSALALDQAAVRRRPFPRLLRDLIAVMLFLFAFGATVALFMGQGATGALAGSGLIIAMLGFAIRNVVADTLSGIALGVEGPFRIGDWVDVDGLARGKVMEIGWRTTRVLTRDATYLILPNSQIARQRITNYSAPRPQYRAQVSIILDQSIPIALAKSVMLEAVKEAKLIQQDPSPDVRVLSYDAGGIAYGLRYWLTRFDKDIDCRDEVYSLVDNALRKIGNTAPRRRIELVAAANQKGDVAQDISGLINLVGAASLLEPIPAQ